MNPNIDQDERMGFVVNFFTVGGPAQTVLVAATQLNLTLLTAASSVGRVLLVDGSPIPCEPMRAICERLQVEYLHAGRELSYVEAYNLGIQTLKNPFIGLIANDVVPHPIDSLDRLYDWIQRDRVGCAFPYIATSRALGDEVQTPGFARRGSVTCEPASFALNLAVFRRDVLERIELLDERFRAGYQEPILLLKIRKLGYRAVLVGGTRALHLDQLTKLFKESHIDGKAFENDNALWLSEYPQYATRRGVANIRMSSRPFSTTWLNACSWRLAEAIPIGRVRRFAQQLAMWWEPLLCRSR